MTEKKHDWNTLENYLVVHKRVLSNFSKHMIKEKNYTIDRITDQYMELRAEGILFQTFNNNTVRVDIRKDVEIDPSNKKRPRARTFNYTYSANTPGGNFLIRYCSPHKDVGPKVPDHHKFHHKHIYKEGKETVLKLEADQRPQIDKFLKEVLETL